MGSVGRGSVHSYIAINHMRFRRERVVRSATEGSLSALRNDRPLSKKKTTWDFFVYTA